MIAHRHTNPLRKAFTALLFIFAALQVVAQYEPPASYYNDAEGKTGSDLQSALHNIIDDHTKLSYSACWGAIMVLDEDPDNSNNILALYSNRSIPKSDRDGSTSASIKWNREHSWPKSLGFPTSSWPAYTDLHHLFASQSTYNSSRGNKHFDWSNGSTYTVVGQSDVNSADSDSWEPWDSIKGDLARAMFYMAVRYEGDKSNEPDLTLWNGSTSTGSPRMSKLTTLLEWHALDPVDDVERRRNHLIYTQYQGNRNPFIDRPELVCEIWGGDCGGTPPPPPPPSGPETLASGSSVSSSVAQGTWKHYKISVPSNASKLTVAMTGNNDADLYVRRGSQPTSGSWDFRPYIGGSNETVVVNNSSSPALVAGNTYFISVYGYSSSTSSYSLTATIESGSTPPPPPPSGTVTLSSGSSVSASVANGTWKHYKISVPSNASKLTVAMTGNNDADLYVRRGSEPTSGSWDFRPYIGGSNETVVVDSSSSPALVAGNTYYISVYGYSSTTSSISLTATVQTGGSTPPPPPSDPQGTLSSGQSVSSTVAQGSWKNYTIFVPSNASSLKVELTGSGDGDLYVKSGSMPTLNSYDFRPYEWGTNETVNLTGSSLQKGTMYYIAVQGYEAANFTLKATIN